MGLDIYLYKCADRAAAKRSESAFETEWEAVENERFGEKPWDDMSESERSERDAARLVIAERCGTDTWGCNTLEEKIEIASSIDAEHYFKVGYFRSSYNNGGINNVMRVRGFPKLDDIFAHDGEYETAPDWQASLIRCTQAITDFAAFLDSPTAKYSSMVVQHNPFMDPKLLASSEQDAVQRFAAMMAKVEDRGDSGGFGNGDGDFYPAGLKVVAILHGTYESWNGAQLAQYVIVEKDPHETLGWYLTALKIVRETIEYVIAQPDAANYYFHWSS